MVMYKKNVECASNHSYKTCYALEKLELKTDNFCYDYGFSMQPFYEKSSKTHAPNVIGKVINQCYLYGRHDLISVLLWNLSHHDYHTSNFRY